MFSLFTTCKPFEGFDDIHQRNALRSWCALTPRPEIIVIGNDAGVAAVCEEYGLKHVPDMAVTAYGKPDVRDVFQRGIAVATNDLLAYVNADIILLQDFADAIERTTATFPRALMSGQRWNIDYDELTTDWAEVRRVVKWEGELLPPTGMDYFVFRRGMLADLVQGLGIGHLAWDNYLPWYAVHKDNAVFINLTDHITAVHQNHPVPELGDHPGAAANHKLVRAQHDKGECGLTLLDAKHWKGKAPMEGRLFDDKIVALDPRTMQLGGAWWQREEHLHDPLPVANDADLVRLAWTHIKDIPNPVVIDVGASTGMMVLLAAFIPGMTGIAFEPCPEPFAVLNQDIWLNGLQDRIQARAVAVGDKPGIADFYITNDHFFSGLNRLGREVTGHPCTSYAVPVVTLDEACLGMRPTIIKVDVEGNELEVIRGAEQLIKQHKPILLLECPETDPPSLKANALHDLLKSWGAAIQRINTANILATWEEAKAQPASQTVSIVIPSMNRPERLEGCVKRILETTPHKPLEVIAVIDCDTDSRDRLLALHDERVKVLFNETRKGAIACWNQGLAAATGDILAFFNDDCMPEPGWLEAALKAHKEQLNGYGMIGFNDGYQDGNVLSVQFLYDRKFCVDVLGGVMAYPVYGFAYNDTEAHARAKNSGHFYWCREAVVQHNHWSRPGVGNGPDALNQENMALQGKDGHIFTERQAHGFPNNFEPVLKRAA